MAMAHKVLVSNLDFPILVRAGFGLSTQACKKCFFIVVVREGNILPN